MAVLDKLNAMISKSTSSSLGLSRGERGGHLGVWVKRGELYRVAFHYQGQTKTGKVFSGHFSYTFGPAVNSGCFQSLEMPRSFKEFLVGKEPAKTGSITVDFISEGGKNSKSYELRPILLCYRQKGAFIPGELCHRAWLMPDTAELASIKENDLKAHSEKIKAELEEKRKKEEAEKRAQEEAAKKAAEEAAKVAAAKAAAASKPAATAAASGPVDRSKPTLPNGKMIVVYGSSTGNTKNVADAVKAEFGEAVDHVKNITEIHPADLAQFEKVIVGVPTWHIGEIQEDWGAVLPEIEALNFQGKKVAVFGLGDGKGYPETYVDAMAELVEKFEKKGAKLIGMWPTEGYEFKKSKALRDGKFLGLVIDVENQDHLSDKRVKAWVAQLQKEL
ncbi:MAG: flavodoxin [Proteobacteria bacterium]|nr:flavodoxin [Pseudomonadota bacterium]NDC24695.1 flavodoxin [Pseudomonadota bacterium]NDD04626.1 flavodoxin [Pseudomonadota bacterium]